MSQIENLIEQITVEAILDWRKSEQIEIFDEDSFTYQLAKSEDSSFNCVIKNSLTGKALQSKIKSLRERLENENKGITWFQFPSFARESLSVLEENGFNPIEVFTGMAAKIEDLHPGEPKIPHIETKEVTSEEDLIHWINISSKVYEFSSEGKRVWGGVHRSLGFGKNSQWKHYLAFLDDTPVATSTVFKGKDGLRISNVAVLPEYRKKGLGQFITVKPLLDKKDYDKNEIVTLISTSMAVRSYTNAGFSDYFSCPCWMKIPDQTHQVTSKMD